jgi:hypothetical protein
MNLFERHPTPVEFFLQYLREPHERIEILNRAFQFERRVAYGPIPPNHSFEPIVRHSESSCPAIIRISILLSKLKLQIALDPERIYGHILAPILLNTPGGIPRRNTDRSLSYFPYVRRFVHLRHRIRSRSRHKSIRKPRPWFCALAIFELTGEKAKTQRTCKSCLLKHVLCV